MSGIVFFLVLAASLFLALVVQSFIPPLPWLEGARVLLMPLVLFYGALAMPLAGMLALSFVAGFMWDALNTTVFAPGPLEEGMQEALAVEIGLGWSILVYAALGAIMSGFRPLFQRGRWEIHCLLSGICTSLIVLAEYAMITFRRGDPVFNSEVWWRIGGAGIIALMVSPIVFFLLNMAARAVGFDYRPQEGLIR